MALKKPKSEGKKKKKNERRKVKSKHYTKHYLYCVLCCRFNATQRIGYMKRTELITKIRNNENKTNITENPQS